ncbi:deleted in malignant brain tumors 1 protein-like isoform X2 [Pomacea canaliculata]|uniref:deleted in malignant brain tumors 1 protein-like isoform X2 n=1 Tax=Pomacea canaliculata TaxID=400727 RepID=UPI000D728C99|nr:deleted in malignant brain tumors 1 protein-like isoform X2 [Pomacea canaliculata]
MCNLSSWPTPQMSARVVGGTAAAGLLEIFYDGAWSTVCDDGFGQEEVLVACRMLGFNSTTAIPVGSYKYGEGSGLILFDKVECQGDETSLAQCNHSGFYIHSCYHSEDVGVICNSAPIIAKLVDGTSDAGGRLELFVNGQWGTVCDKGFGQEDALVACRMMGFNSSEKTATAVSSFKYREGTGAILLADLKCNGTETRLEQCNNALFYNNQCEHSQDVGIICNANPVIARLANGTSEAGRLELFVNGEWGTVCNDEFDREDAIVACRMLGFNSTAMTATAITSKYGQGSGEIFLSNLMCRGSETSLEQCSHTGFYYHYCDHSQDVGIVCNIQPIRARLVGGTSEAGRLELFFNGEWGTVCDKGFIQTDAQVACRMLGFHSTATNATTAKSSKYGQGSGDILLSDLMCRGTESSLEQCSHPGFYNNRCDHLQDVGIICKIIEQMRARVVNGTSAAGRLEIFFNGEWGTVCSGIGFQNEEAQVACRMLGFNSTGAAVVDTVKYGPGTGPVLLQHMRCKGTESSLAQCGIQLYSSNCDHENDVGVICNIMSDEQLAARLADGTSEAGRLEILFDGEWGTVCGVGFEKREAEVACRMLGFNSTGALAISSVKYGPGAGPILFEDVKCQGTESSLAQCKIKFFYSRSCDHEKGVGIICNITTPMTARLYGGTPEAGLLQISVNGEWTTVCPERFEQNEIELACRMLGFNSTGQTAVRSVRFGAGSEFRFAYINCKGMETNLEQCEFGKLHKIHCFDVGLLCDIKTFSLRLTGPHRTDSNMGRVEVKIGSKHFSTVCVNNEKTAAVICRQLNLTSNGAALVDGWVFGAKKSPLLEAGFFCNGNENSLFECGRNKSTEDCYADDVGVVCSKDYRLYIVSEAEKYPFMEGTKEVLMCVKPRKYIRVLEYIWSGKGDGRSQGNRLFYDNLTRDYNGRQVLCQASNPDGAFDLSEHLQSGILVLNVYYKPLITITWTNNTGEQQPLSSLSELNPGHNVTLWCEADSNPPPASITWSGRVNSTTGELRILAADHVTHSGVYTCTVVTETADDDDRLPLTSSYHLTLSVQAHHLFQISH